LQVGPHELGRTNAGDVCRQVSSDSAQDYQLGQRQEIDSKRARVSFFARPDLQLVFVLDITRQSVLFRLAIKSPSCLVSFVLEIWTQLTHGNEVLPDHVPSSNKPDSTLLPKPQNMPNFSCWQSSGLVPHTIDSDVECGMPTNLNLDRMLS
jgi:hypothetical protein